MEIKLIKTLTKKDDKTYCNFYIDLGVCRIAIKPSFKGDYFILNKFSKLYVKED